jgi:NAD(P)-dependent dehydrogenase (short-subunit alcohol dehydrogenase family)
MSTQADRSRVDGRVALITGGAGLMGVEHAVALLDIGAKVVLADINPAALDGAISKLGQTYAADRILGVQMDVTSEDSIVSVEKVVEEKLGPVDILVNNAAIDPKVDAKSEILEASRLEQFSRLQWDIELGVGLTGAFLCSKVFGTAMAARGHGVILNVASDLSVFAPDQRLYRKDGLPADRQPVKPVTYSVIKTGLIGLTRYLAGYWATDGVRANAISPGGIYNGQPNAFVAKLTNLIPMGRMADRDEYHGAVQFLCSDASRYMTGQNIVVDGGRSVL